MSTKKILSIFILLMILIKPSVSSASAPIENAWASCQANLSQTLRDTGYACTNYPAYGFIGTSNNPNDPNSSFNNINYGLNGGCTSPAVFNTTNGLCTSPTIACPSGQYAPSGSTSTAQCVAIPNCNSSSPADGKFFNVTTGQCVNAAATTICISPVDRPGLQVNLYCPPVDDCKPTTYVCSNHPDTVAAEQNAKVAALAAIKAAADPKVTQAADAASTAAAAKTAKDNAKTASLAAAAAAKYSSDAVAASTNSTPQQILTAANSYASAVSDSVISAAKAANSLLAAAASQAAADDAVTHDNAISSSNVGNATVYGDLVTNDLIKALTASSDAVGGTGSGTGTGSGQPTGQPNLDTTSLAKDSTAAGIKTALDGLAAGTNTSSGYATLPAAGFYTSKYPSSLSGLWETKKTAFTQTSFVSAINTLMPNIANGGTCPSWSLPMPFGLSSQPLTMPCEIWGFLRIVFMITALFYARQIIFG